MSSPSWNPGRRHGTQTTESPKICLVSSSPSAAVATAIPESGCKWSTCARIDQAVHRGVDRRRRAALAVQAEVERRDHLVLPIDPGIDVHQRPQPIQPQHRQPRLFQRAQVPAGTLHPHQLDRLAGHRVDLGALRRGVPTGIVRVLRIRSQPVRPRSISSVNYCPLSSPLQKLLSDCRKLASQSNLPTVFGKGGSWSRAPAGLASADPLGCDLALIARLGVGLHRVGRQATGLPPAARSGRTSV